MGTFHHDHDPLHGITVVVETRGATLCVGRYHEADAEGLLLLDADRHAEGDGGVTNADFLAKTARGGVWKKFDRLRVPTSEIVSIRRLAEFATR